MYIPIVPRATIINKTIVYSDTVLPLKDSGSNLKVNSISNVGEFQLERCLRTIFESNPDVIFNTIQYSRNDKKVYFYTDKDINTKKWTDSLSTIKKPLNDSKLILEEVKEILGSEIPRDTDSIALYDVFRVFKKRYNEYERLKDSYERTLKIKCHEKMRSSFLICVHDFDYDKNELEIAINHYSDWKKIIFTKIENGDLVVKESESYRDNDILAMVGSDLSELYDKFLLFKEYMEQNNYKVDCVNSDFNANISKYCVSFFVPTRVSYISKDFEVASYTYDDDDEYKYQCNSTVVMSALQGRERELFKRIFVKINDCPEWSRDTLQNIRDKQIYDLKMAEDASFREQEYKKMREQRKEERKEKSLRLIRKVFFFIKK